MTSHTLISTVGTSLLTNLENLRRAPDAGVEPLLRAYDARRWKELAEGLHARGPDARVCGAEVNSIHDLLTRGLLQAPPFALHFCLSDTERGRMTGEILRHYFESLGQQVRLHAIEGLQDDNPGRFRTEGLRNLARKVGEIVRQTGDPMYVAINATGGYKAQIAIAVLIGQAMGLPVFYKHELFPEIIAFPPMPLSFDYDLLGRHADVLDELEREGVVEMPEGQVDDALRVLLEEAEGSDGKTLWALAPIGQIYLEGFRQRYPVEKTLPSAATNRSAPTYGNDHHYPNGFKEYVNKVWRDNGYIITCHSISYHAQSAIRDRVFYVASDGQIIGEYRKGGDGARFAIMTTATTAAQKAAVVAHLNQKYGRE
ncbi:MAG TPA: putative CRISPR-associated protein [Blastocatellia bacterium]|nr:putative CRISPR-associated protein [Blastocatellia bacterium]